MRIKNFKIFESINKMDTIKDVFTDLEFEEFGLDVEFGDNMVNINKVEWRQEAPTFMEVADSIERILITKEEYIKFHELFISKITYLHDIGIDCHNIIFTMMDYRYASYHKALTDYFSKYHNMDNFLNYLFINDEPNKGFNRELKMSGISIKF